MILERWICMGSKWQYQWRRWNLHNLERKLLTKANTLSLHTTIS